VTASAEVLLAACGWTAAGLAAVWLRCLLVRRAALVAQAAHEVRGPLCAAGLALHGAAGDPARVAAVELELRRAGMALEDLTRAPRGRRTREVRAVVDARDVVGEAVAAWRPVAAAFGANLRLDPASAAAPVLADRLRMAQAVANLVLNAAEHGEGDVVVRVRPAGASVRIEVRDDGPGPSPVRVAAAARARGRGARGHGLTVAARVAARHGGRLFVASRDGDRGSAVVLELPRCDGTGAHAPRRIPRWSPGLFSAGHDSGAFARRRTGEWRRSGRP
jgi:signal transduction histidine kinase